MAKAMGRHKLPPASGRAQAQGLNDFQLITAVKILFPSEAKQIKKGRKRCCDEIRGGKLNLLGSVSIDVNMFFSKNTFQQMHFSVNMVAKFSNAQRCRVGGKYCQIFTL